MWLKVLNLEQNLFPQLQTTLGPLSPKEEKLIKILDFAKIETFVSTVQITNPPKDREELARAFVAKSVYNFQTTRALIDRLSVDKTLRILCGWRYRTHLPSESKFSRVFDEFSTQGIASKAQDMFIEKYLKEAKDENISIKSLSCWLKVEHPSIYKNKSLLFVVLKKPT